MDLFTRNCYVQIANAVDIIHGSLLAIIAYNDGAHGNPQEERFYSSPAAPPPAPMIIPAFGEQTEKANGVLEFSEMEIRKMPKKLQNQIKAQGGNSRWIRLKDNGVYEIRMTYMGVQIAASSKDLATAKKKFLEKLKSIAVEETTGTPERKNGVVILKDFATTWYDTIKKPTLKDSSLEDIERQLRLHILPKFGDRNMADMRPMEIRAFLNEYIEEDHIRTAEKIYTILNDLFECACGEEYVGKNPLKRVPKPDYEADSGVALTKEHEKLFIERLFEQKHPCRYAMIFLLYTGMRRSELKDATFDGTWITTKCAKTRKGKDRFRKIPITPMLRPYMEHFTAENICFKNDRLSRVLPKILPGLGYKTHHLRHTYITRAQECSVPELVVKLWVGHALDKRDMTESVYTHLSDDFLLQEAEKIMY